MRPLPLFSFTQFAERKLFIDAITFLLQMTWNTVPSLRSITRSQLNAQKNNTIPDRANLFKFYERVKSWLIKNTRADLEEIASQPALTSFRNERASLVSSIASSMLFEPQITKRPQRLTEQESCDSSWTGRPISSTPVAHLTAILFRTGAHLRSLLTRTPTCLESRYKQDSFSHFVP